MRRSCLLIALLPSIGLVIGSSAKSESPDSTPVVRKPREPKIGDVYVPYSGTVTELSKTSITIRFGNLMDQKPKRFPVSETLASGKFAKERFQKPGQTTRHWVLPGDKYRLADVRVGDWVTIHYAHLDTGDLCEHICITKRPGGRVPALPEEDDPPKTQAGNPRIRYHEWMNAYWDLEDKGIPYPERFGMSRRWPTAPMPRKLTLDGPIISK